MLLLGDNNATNGKGDLRIFHDGTESIIWDNGTGGIVLQSASSAIEMRAIKQPGGGGTDTEVMLKATPGGSIDLYEDGTKRLETTNVGATVTGELTSTTLKVNGLTTVQQLDVFNSTSATQQTFLNPGGIELKKSIDYRDDGTTPNAGPFIDFIRAGDSDHDARIQMDASGGGSGSQDGDLVFYTPTSGSLPADGAVTERFRVQRDGAKVTGELRVTGDIIGFYAASDKNLKDNITPIEDPLAKVLSISGNTFNWNDKSEFEGQGDTGVVAQEIEALGLPGIVKDQESGHKSVQYHKLVPLLIEAIKELSTKVENLEQKLQDK